MMLELDRQYPGYGFAAHKGYPTPEHRKAFLELGPCPVHRMSFPVIHEMLGECTAAFYELRAQLFAAEAREALAELEAALKARAAEVSEQELKRLRLLLGRRWKAVG
jgi:ribonuclease HII